MLLWEEEWAMLQLAAEAHPWEARSPDIFFRGGPASNEFRKALNSSMAAWRAKHEPMSAGDRDVAALQALDLVLTSVFQPGAVRVPFPEHCQHKVRGRAWGGEWRGSSRAGHGMATAAPLYARVQVQRTYERCDTPTIHSCWAGWQSRRCPTLAPPSSFRCCCTSRA